MKLATWNVNSIKVRLPRVLEFLELHRPDVLCLQETKSTPEAFPHDDLAKAGYHAVDHCGGRWAGVAILVPSDVPAEEPICGLPAAPLADEARWVEASVGGLRVVSVYVVNGRALDDPMYEAKLGFLDAMIERCRDLRAGDALPLFVAGDFNIAPADLDVWSPERFVGATHVSEPERERLRALLDVGLVDAYRHIEPEAVQHTWWDYRQGHFHRGMGLRIDLALVDERLAPEIRAAGIDRDFRKGPKPSDHAPLLVDLDW